MFDFDATAAEAETCSDQPVCVVETSGLEPPTPCVQSRCSSQLSYVPRPVAPGRTLPEYRGQPALSAPSGGHQPVA